MIKLPQSVDYRISRSLNAINKMHAIESQRLAEEKMQEKKYNEEVLSTLKAIEKNTGDIGQIVSLLQKNIDIQDEILETMNSILEIAKAKSPKEADTMYRKALDKANELNDDLETATALLGYAKTVWMMVKSTFGV